MSDIKFNSQVCTNLEQSKKLLDLGLKPETADMCYQTHYLDLGGVLKECVPSLEPYPPVNNDRFIPAWSLHRLIELIPQDIHLDDYADTHYYLVIKPSRVLYMNDYKEWLYYNDDTNYYNRLIDCIRWTMEQKLFNKEYLKQ